MSDKRDTVVQNRDSKSNRIRKNILFFRWVFILFVFPTIFFTSPNASSKVIFLETLAITIIYNFFITVYMLRDEENNKKYLDITTYIDILIISAFSYLMGGLSSDIYIVLLFVIGCYGFYNNINKISGTSIFTLVVYSLSCFYGEKNSLEAFNFGLLIVRDFAIILAAYSVSVISKEVKKHDEARKKEFKLARTDKLTGLANRHYFEQKLVEEVEYSNASGNPLNTLIFDLDNFKKFNDSYGHIWGDKLLSLFSDIIKQNIRKSDIPIRYGGEEFLILIRDLDMEMAKGIGERIRRQLEKQRIYVGSDENRKRVTVSCGLAQYPKHSKDIKEVIDLADKSLYHAKEIGKNIVVSYDEIGKVERSTAQGFVDVDAGR